MTGVKSRLTRGLGAQGFSQAVQVFIRLAEVPLFLGQWGTQLYGEWLMLAAIPTYLAMGDGGFTSAANHDMAMRASAGDREGALIVFRSTWLLISLLSLLIGLAATLAVVALPLAQWLGMQAMDAATVQAVCLLLVAHALVGLQTGLLNGVYWCEGRYATGMSLGALMRLIEFGGLAAPVLLGGGPVAAATGYLAGRVVGLVIMRVGLYPIAPWLRYGWAGASGKEMRRLTRPAFASLAFPLGNALNIQGMRLVVGLVLGPAAVAVFAPIRTLSQLALQPQGVVNLLLEPEMALAYGDGQTRLFRTLFRRSCQVVLWATTPACLLVGVAGGTIMTAWTRGQVPMEWPLFILLLAAAVVNSLWSTALIVAYATNRHERIAVVYVTVYGGALLAFGYVGAHLAGFTGVGIALLLAELPMAAYVLTVVLRMTGETWANWARTLASPPFFLVHGWRSTVTSEAD